MSMPNQPRVLLVAGPNGTGKTTITERGLAHAWFQDCEYINPNVIARDQFGDWNDPVAIRQAADWAAMRRTQCLEQYQSLAFESVFSSDDKVDFLRRAQSMGYFSRLFFVGTSNPSINAERVARRVMQGGHDVPIPKIIARYYRSIANCVLIGREVNRLYLYDNSRDGEEAKLIIRIADGKIIKQYTQIPRWAEPIIEAL